MIHSLEVPERDSELYLEDSGGSGASLRLLDPDQREVVLNPDDVKAIHAWTALWLADRYGSEATELPSDLPAEWKAPR